MARAMQTVDEDILGLIENNRLDEAESILTIKIAANDKDLSALSMLGETYRRKGDRTKALKYLQKAMALDYSYPYSHLYMGKLYFTMQNFDVAAKEFEEFRELGRSRASGQRNDGEYLGGLHDISILYMGFKMYDNFLDVNNEILSLSPQDQAANYNMGIYHYTVQRNRPRAYEYFKNVIAINPSSGISAKAKYAIEYMRTNSDPRMEADFSFIDQEFRD